MHCPFCQFHDTRVIDSRLADDGDTVRRRRECESCAERFTTMENASLKLPYIVKSNGQREQFNEAKIRRGVDRALEKRPVGADQIDSMMHRIRNILMQSGEREIRSVQLGELIIFELRKLDKVAYVRFASVYRSFEDVDQFSEEIQRLQKRASDRSGLRKAKKKI
jgi:transcriptional repressor NrdR